jgi:hypothetical protein
VTCLLAGRVNEPLAGEQPERDRDQHDHDRAAGERGVK